MNKLFKAITFVAVMIIILAVLAFYVEPKNQGPFAFAIGWFGAIAYDLVMN